MVQNGIPVKGGRAGDALKCSKCWERLDALPVYGLCAVCCKGGRRSGTMFSLSSVNGGIRSSQDGQFIV